jgi:hypothetical protein
VAVAVARENGKVADTFDVLDEIFPPVVAVVVSGSASE